MWLKKGLNLGPQGASGEPRLWHQFMANLGPDADGRVIPMQASAMVGLRYLTELVHRKLIPRPRIIYLDTSHDYPETELELRLAFELLAPGGILTGDDYDKFFPAVQQSVNEFVALLPPGDLAEPSAWAAGWQSRGMRRVEADGRLLPLLLIRQQWLLMKSAPDAAAPDTAASASPPDASLARSALPTVRCCIGGWADPMVHTLSNAWCGGAAERRAKCAASQRRDGMVHSLCPARAAARAAQLLRDCARASDWRTGVPMGVWLPGVGRYAILRSQRHALDTARRAEPPARLRVHLRIRSTQRCILLLMEIPYNLFTFS